MKRLEATAGGTTPASMDRCFALIVAIDDYPKWCGHAVREARVLKRDEAGRPTEAHAALHVSAGPLTRDFHLDFAVTVNPPRGVSLTRVPHHSRDHEEFNVAWRLTDGPQTRIDVDFRAHLSIPSFMPVGGIAESIAREFVDSALRALS
jgi:hypothetical protein